MLLGHIRWTSCQGTILIRSSAWLCFAVYMAMLPSELKILLTLGNNYISFPGFATMIVLLSLLMFVLRIRKHHFSDLILLPAAVSFWCRLCLGDMCIYILPCYKRPYLCRIVNRLAKLMADTVNQSMQFASQTAGTTHQRRQTSG